MNPVLPPHIHIPDPEARVWDDGRLYLYGSMDLPGADHWCSDQYEVFSSDNLRDWTGHGVCLRKEDIEWATHRPLAAPDCIFYNGRYRLFLCMNGLGGREGVADSDHPGGPFENPRPIEGADFDGIDPAVLLDDDGSLYLYWGQMRARGAKIKPDLSGIEPDSLQTDLLSSERDGFIEGSSMRKIDGRYYLVYSDASTGLGTRLSYAVGEHPLGPFERKGVIIDNIHCDPYTWNNHGSICQFKGQWYVFYHRSSKGSRFNRRTCVEPIQILPDGTIPEVPMTTQGADGPLPASRRLEAYRACYYYGSVHNTMDGDNEVIGNTREGDFVSYRYLKFSGKERSVRLRVRGHGSITLHLDVPYWVPAASVQVDSDAWVDVDATFPASPGVHSLHLSFKEAAAVEVDWFQFH